MRLRGSFSFLRACRDAGQCGQAGGCPSPKHASLVVLLICTASRAAARAARPGPPAREAPNRAPRPGRVNSIRAVGLRQHLEELRVRYRTPPVLVDGSRYHRAVAVSLYQGLLPLKIFVERKKIITINEKNKTCVQAAAWALSVSLGLNGDGAFEEPLRLGGGYLVALADRPGCSFQWYCGNRHTQRQSCPKWNWFLGQGPHTRRPAPRRTGSRRWCCSGPSRGIRFKTRGS